MSVSRQFPNPLSSTLTTGQDTDIYDLWLVSHHNRNFSRVTRYVRRAGGDRVNSFDQGSILRPEDNDAALLKTAAIEIDLQQGDSRIERKVIFIHKFSYDVLSSIMPILNTVNAPRAWCLG